MMSHLIRIYTVCKFSCFCWPLKCLGEWIHFQEKKTSAFFLLLLKKNQFLIEFLHGKQILSLKIDPILK